MSDSRQRQRRSSQIEIPMQTRKSRGSVPNPDFPVDWQEVGGQLLCNAIQKAIPEEKTTTGRRVISSVKATDSDTVIFAYGTSEQKVKAVVNDVLSRPPVDYLPRIVLSPEEAENLSTNGLSGSKWRDVVVAKLRENRNFPKILMIMLEHCNPIMLSDLLRSGVLDLCKAKRVHLVTMCWSLEYQPKVYGGHFESHVTVKAKEQVELGIVVHKIPSKDPCAEMVLVPMNIPSGEEPEKQNGGASEGRRRGRTNGNGTTHISRSITSISSADDCCSIV